MKLRSSRAKRDSGPKASSTHWEEVLKSFIDPIVVFDRGDRIVLFNHAAEELTGMPQGKALGQPCARVFAITPLIAEMVSRVRFSGQNESRGEEHLQQRRRSIPVRISCIPVWGPGDRIDGTAMVIHDLSYQRTLEESAHRNESLARLGTLVAGLAHEIKNPLAGIKGAAQLLEGKLAETPGLHEYTGVIVREVNRLSALVEDLLALGAPAKPRLTHTNIHRVVQHVLALVGEELTRRDIHLRCEFDPSLPHIQADDAQLSQVLLNLIRNAIDAMTAEDGQPRPGSKLTVSTRMETDFHILRARNHVGKFLRIEIADEGKGIEEADVSRIFEPFFTTKPRGTGLGLAISHRIVAEHGGILRVHPNRPRGSVFTVTLPVT
jgi:two-component system, NtrC family, nitrogen regulation sensor histidine kinase GlnL